MYVNITELNHTTFWITWLMQNSYIDKNKWDLYYQSTQSCV